MQAIRHEDHPKEVWRPGVVTRMQVSALTGSQHLCAFEQWIDPGKGAPTHRHPVEEILTVVEGAAEVRLGTSSLQLEKGQSVVVPAGARHGFTNSGTTVLHMQAVLASRSFEALFDDGTAVRRWTGDAAETQNDTTRTT